MDQRFILNSEEEGRRGVVKILSLLLLVASFVISTFAKAATPLFTIAISPENSQVMAGFPLRVKTLLTNTSNHPMNVSHELGELDLAYRYEVRDSGGRLLGQKKVETPAQGSVVVIMLKPGESSAGLTDLSAGFDLTRPGVYSVQMRKPVSTDPNAEVIESNIVMVTVTEARPFMLRIGGYANGRPGTTEEGVVAKVGENVGINIEMRNMSTHEIDCSGAWSNLSDLDEKYQYDVRDSSGNPVARHRIESPLPYTRGPDIHSCKPGESGSSGNNSITRLYGLNRPGVYTIQVSRVVSDNPADGVVKSNKIMVTVTP